MPRSFIFSTTSFQQVFATCFPFPSSSSAGAALDGCANIRTSKPAGFERGRRSGGRSQAGGAAARPRGASGSCAGAVLCHHHKKDGSSSSSCMRTKKKTRRTSVSCLLSSSSLISSSSIGSSSTMNRKDHESGFLDRAFENASYVDDAELDSMSETTMMIMTTTKQNKHVEAAVALT